MSAKVTSEQIAKLPKWARDHIAGLEAEIAMRDKGLAAFTDGLGQPVKYPRDAEATMAAYGKPMFSSLPLLRASHLMPLAFPCDSPHLTLSGLRTLAEWEEARSGRRQIDYFDIQQDTADTSLRVSTGGRGLSIEPWSTNVAILRLRDR